MLYNHRYRQNGVKMAQPVIYNDIMTIYLTQFAIDTPVTTLEQGDFEYTDLQNEASYTLYKTQATTGAPKYLLAITGHIKAEDMAEYIQRDVYVTPDEWIVPTVKRKKIGADRIAFTAVNDKILDDLVVLDDAGKAVLLLDVMLDREESTYFTL